MNLYCNPNPHIYNNSRYLEFGDIYMNKWLIVHSLTSYTQNPKMIGFSLKVSKASKISPGDKIIYYCKGESVIIGLFEVVQSHFDKEIQWPDAQLQYEIKPIIELDNPYNFKHLISSLDLFKNMRNMKWWGAVLRGKSGVINLLTNNDYNIIEKTLLREKSKNPYKRKKF